MSDSCQPEHEPVGRPELIVVETRRSSADREVPARAAETSDLEPFAVAVQRRDHVTIVQPRGELDIATVETLRTTLDAAVTDTLRATRDGFESTARVVLDLRGLTFIDSTGLHLLVALDRRAHRDGFLLSLLAPAGPVARAIELCGLDQILPLATPDDALGGEPSESRFRRQRAS